jgi:hypothetical protein
MMRWRAAWAPAVAGLRADPEESPAGREIHGRLSLGKKESDRESFSGVHRSPHFDQTGFDSWINRSVRTRMYRLGGILVRARPSRNPVRM